MPEALTAYAEALTIYKQLAQKNPDAFLQDVAGTQNNLGNLYQVNKRFPEALTAYSEALTIYKQLAQKNPDAYLQYVANTQYNLGLLYLKKGQLISARDILNEAVTTRGHLTTQNPRAFEIELCASMIVLGVIHLTLYENNSEMPDLEKADSLLTAIINRLNKYPDVPRAIKLLTLAKEYKQMIDNMR